MGDLYTPPAVEERRDGELPTGYASSNFARLPVAKRTFNGEVLERGLSSQLSKGEVSLTEEESIQTSSIQLSSKLNIKLSAMEGVTRYGEDSVYRSGEPHVSVFQYKLQISRAEHKATQDPKAIYKQFDQVWSGTSSKCISTEQQHKLGRLMKDGALVRCGGTFVPCNEHGDPVLGGLCRWVRPALLALFECLTRDGDHWLEKTVSEQHQHRFVWVREVTTEQTRVGPCRQYTLRLKLRSEKNATDLDGFGMDVKHWKQLHDQPIGINIIRPSPQQTQDHDEEREICSDDIPTLRNRRSTRIIKEQPDYMALHRGQVVGMHRPHGKGIMIAQEKLPCTNAQNLVSHELLRASVSTLAFGPTTTTTSSTGSGKSTRASSIFTSEVATPATSMTDGDSISRAVVLRVRNKDEFQQIISLPPSPKPSKIVVLPLGPSPSFEVTKIMAQASQSSLNQPLSQSSGLSLSQRPKRKRAAPARFAGDDLVSTKRQRC